MASTEPCDDRIVLDLWHPIAAVAEVVPGRQYTTLLLGESIGYTRGDDGEPIVWRTSAPDQHLPVIDEFCFIWTSLGDPPEVLFELPQFAEPDRRSLGAGSIGVATSAPRAVENFLDMGHFPYIHRGILGEEPHTEVVDYDVEINEANEVVATRCRFWQPMAAATAIGGQMIEYVYRVPHPYCAVLYKTAPPDPARMDVIAIFLQAMTEERIRAHNFLCMLDDTNTDTELKAFQQMIFGQDKPILENQRPLRLPLSPRAETPIRSDKTSIHYRRWLSELGVTYGVIPVNDAL